MEPEVQPEKVGEEQPSGKVVSRESQQGRQARCPRNTELGLGEKRVFLF